MSARPADPRVQHDVIRDLLARTPAVIGTNVVAALLFVGGLYETEGSAIVLWAVFYCLLQGPRLLVWRGFQRDADPLAHAAAWGRRHALCVLVIGAAYGLPVLLLFPHDDLARQLFCLSALAVTAIGAAVTNLGYPPSLLAFVVPSLLQGAVRAWGEDGAVFGALAVCLVALIPVLAYFSVSQARVLRLALAARYENLALVAELTEQKQAAERANRAKSSFFAAASHDLRQPLQALGLHAAALRETRRDPADARRVDQILSSIDALEALFDELLDISRLDAGHYRPALSHVPVSEVFERLEAACRPLARRSGLELAFDHAGAVAHTDAVLIERVLGNFLGNALRYTAAGFVTVRCLRRGDRLVLEVADTGPGIPREEQERIFDEFYQLANPERDRRKGMGLGLATVRRIARLLDCRVSVDSEPGRGSVFSIEVSAGEAAQVTAPSRVPAAADVDALRGRVIGIVEDEREVREGLVEVLASWRCEAVAAASAAELCAKLESGGLCPDAVVADYRLREQETGLSAIRALRMRFGAALPALIVSGDSSESVLREVREAALPLLAKPVRAARLRAALQHLLSDSAAADPQNSITALP